MDSDFHILFSGRVSIGSGARGGHGQQTAGDTFYHSSNLPTLHPRSLRRIKLAGTKEKIFSSAPRIIFLAD